MRQGLRERRASRVCWVCPATTLPGPSPAHAQAKQERLRQAKAEAEREIAAYKAEREGAYQKRLAEVRATWVHR